MLKKFSFSDGVADDVAILMPENQASVDCAATFHLLKRFPAAVPQEAFDALEEEVLITSLHLLLPCPLHAKKQESPLRVLNCALIGKKLEE